MSVPDSIVETLRDRAANGESAIVILRWLREVLGPKATFFQFSSKLFLAFDVSIVDLRRLEDWSGLGKDGSMSDEEVEGMLSPLTIRSQPVSGPNTQE